jgi:diguanylate cyclase (GGDEF)-like protein
MELYEEYFSILQKYIAQQNETILYRASILGKEFMQQGIGPEEIVEVHSRAMQKTLALASPCQIPGITLNSFNLLLEIMMAYGLAYQEYMEHKSQELGKLQLYTKKLEKTNKLLEQKVKEQTLIYQFACAFGEVLQTKATANLIVEKTALVVPYDSCILYLWDKNKNTLQEIAASGKALPPPTYRQNTPHWERGVLTIPLNIDGKTLGYLVLSLENKELAEDLLHLLTIIANQAAFALARAMMQEETWRQSITDYKTGLYNFNYFQDLCQQALADNKQLALLMMDLDDFKSFNDNYGHLKGDEALIAVSEEIRKIIRKEDLAARYGGEEFVIALLDTDQTHAHQVAERIRRRISQLDFKIQGNITTSIGIAISPRNGTSFIELFSQADKALYKAKAQGKNRVSVAPQH